MLFGALKVVREKFQTKSNSTPLSNNSRPPNNNHEALSSSDYVVAKDIIKNHHNKGD